MSLKSTLPVGDPEKPLATETVAVSVTD